VDGTALDCYSEVLKKDPNNAEALDGLEQIEAKYLTWIKGALADGNKQKALQYLAPLRKVNPDSPKLRSYEDLLKSESVETLKPCHQLLAGTVFQDRLENGSLGPKMLWIPAGEFKMGDIQGGGGSDEKPVHSVSIKAFAMGQYEVTFAEYDRFAEATGEKKPDDEGWGRGNRPVINVSWHDAVAYAQWLTRQTGKQYRLPTEAQWEYAARAGTETARYWGNSPDEACRYANVYDQTSKKENSDFLWKNHNCTDGYVNTAPVGQFEPNAFGLFDMLGNIWEWTCSRYEGKYSGKEMRCKKPSKNRSFTLRGGDWKAEPQWVRSAHRNGRASTDRNDDVGFRLIISF